jgi:hypothetical protein
MRFYGRFAAAYGTLMLAVFVASIVMQSHIAVGPFGYYGFPVIALIYAIVRYSAEENPALFARHRHEHRIE